MNRRLVRTASGVVLLFVVVVLVALGLRAPFSWSGSLELLAFALVGAALLIRSLRLGAAALLLISGVLVARIMITGSGSTRVATLPDGSSRWLARLIDEQDVSQIGAATLRWWWPLRGAERDGVLSAMHEAYVELHAEEGTVASPVLDTLLLRQEAGAFDTIVIEPRHPAKAAIVFLHGYTGSWTFECWLVARAARQIDAVTVCPATGFAGHWWSREGEAILRATLDRLQARGFQRVFLAGLSNGGIGAAQLAPRLASHLRGLILISGAPSAGAAAGVPTLVVQGEQDPNVSTDGARAYARRTGAAYVGFEGGHFVLLMRRKEVGEALARWLREQTREESSEAPAHLAPVQQRPGLGRFAHTDPLGRALELVPAAR